MNLARRLSNVSFSATVAVKQKADQLKKEGFDIIDLGPGEPDFITPEPICEAAIKAIQDGYTHYTATPGVVELRDAVAHFYQKYHSSLTWEEIIITCGGKHALFNLFMALFQDADEVLVFVPYWSSFPEALKLVGAKPILVPTGKNFLPLIEDIKGRITERTRGLIINSPNNPTGVVYPRKLIDGLVDLAIQEDLYLVSDETYDTLVYGQTRHHSIVSHMGTNEHRLITVGSLSKGFAMTGWRVGYSISHRDLTRRLATVQSHMTTNPCSISQMAALAALDHPELIEPMRQAYDERRKLVLKQLSRIPGMEVTSPEGAFYVYPDVRAFLGKHGMDTSLQMAHLLIEEAGVAVVPSEAFGHEGYIRISYATSDRNLREGLGRMQKFLER